MKVLIDADRIPYALGSAKNDSGTDYLKWPYVKARVDSMIEKVIEECKADTHTLYLTESSSNFRLDYAKILPYKGTRPTEKPYHFLKIREYLLEHCDAVLCKGIEADDQLGIEQYKSYVVSEASNIHMVLEGSKIDTKYSTIISSVDKDLDNIPGLHHSPLTKEVYFVSELEAIRNFYKQMLTGDTVDNILGLYGIGKKSAHLSNIDKLTQELDMYSYVRHLYKKYFGSFWYIYMVENGILLWMLREPLGEVHPILTKFKEFEGEDNVN